MSKELGNGAVLCDVDSRGVVTVTLNRPAVNNAYNEDMIQGLHQALDLLPLLSGARVVVVQGNGKHFQAGADLAWISSVAPKARCCRGHGVFFRKTLAVLVSSKIAAGA